MRHLLFSIFGVSLASLLIGCGSSSPPKVKAPEPERTVIGIFKDKSVVDAKIKLMASCSQSKLFIRPDHNEVTCVRHQLSDAREAMISNLVNDDFARNITDNVKFVITQEGTDARVLGNAFVQFATPLGVEIDSGVKITRTNLLDNASFNMLEALLKQAGATQP
jgi:hypothetical protein